MQQMSLKEIAGILGAEIYDDSVVMGISTDTRTIKPGDLFIPLKGENYDGHRFLEEAFFKGAVAAISSEENIDVSGKVIKVNDTLQSYHRIAAHYRQKFSIPVIAVTGSNGKTTTKDLIAHVLSKKFTVLKTPENFNNEVGVPQTLLGLAPDTEMVVVELAMRGPGQIRQLVEMVKPQIGVITNIGEAHYELLGSYRAIADAKGELLEDLPDTGIAVLNGDDKWFPYLSRKSRATIYSFGQTEDAFIQLKDYRVKGVEGFTIRVGHNAGREYDFTIPFLGFHNVYNSLAAIAVAFIFQVDPSDIQEALDTVERTGRRMEKLVTPDGLIVINDVYNASPSSTEYAIKTLALLENVGRKVIILGDMRELGEISELSHRKIGKSVSEASIDYLVTLGDMGKWIYEGARDAGMPGNRCFWFNERSTAMSFLVELLQPRDIVLIKASRLMKFEEIVDFIVRKKAESPIGGQKKEI